MILFFSGHNVLWVRCCSLKVHQVAGSGKKCEAFWVQETPWIHFKLPSMESGNNSLFPGLIEFMWRGIYCRSIIRLLPDESSHLLFLCWCRMKWFGSVATVPDKSTHASMRALAHTYVSCRPCLSIVFELVIVYSWGESGAIASEHWNYSDARHR